MLQLRFLFIRLFLAFIEYAPVNNILKFASQFTPRGIDPRSSERNPLAELDAIMDKAVNLEHFLSDLNLQEIYFCEARRYFSSRNVSRRFPRKSFNAIIVQMKVLAHELPDFSSACWTKNFPGQAFTFSAREQNCGRNVNPFLWRIYRFKWIDDLKKKSESLSDSDMESTLISTFKKVQEFERNLMRASSTRVQKKIEHNQFYVSLTQDKALQKTAARLLHQYLTQAQNQIFFELIDADLIIHYLNELRQEPGKVLPSDFQTAVPKSLLSIIKNLIPRPIELLADQSMFPVALEAGSKTSNHSSSRQSTYRTSPVRPFHAIWSGIFGKDCLAGDPDHLSKLTAARWTIAVLRDTHTEFVERNGRYQGFIRTVPLQGSMHGPLRSLEIWVPNMARCVLISHPEDSDDLSRRFLFAHWFEAWELQNPHRNQRHIMSSSKIIDNERVKEFLLASPVYSQGVALSTSESLEPVDQLIHEINRILPASTEAKEFYTGSIAIDVTLKDARDIRVLRTFPQEASAHSTGFKMGP